MKYTVYLRQVFIQPCIVVADSRQGVKDKVKSFIEFGATEGIEFMKNESWPDETLPITDEDIDPLDWNASLDKDDTFGGMPV